jgi:hypothetical protein
MYSYAGNQQESTSQDQEDPKQVALSMKRPSTREKMDVNSAKIQNPYFSRTMNQIDVSPGGGSNNQLPPKKALTN